MGHRILYIPRNRINPNAFITEWDLPSGSFSLPLRAVNSYNMTVDWGDGSPLSVVTSYSDIDATHTYAAGTYRITIIGLCEAWYINNGTIATYLYKIIQWGNMGFKNLEYSFKGCNNLNSLPNGAITGAYYTVNIRYMFQDCSKITSIPNGFLSEFKVLNSVSAMWRGTGITTLPSDFFTYTPNALVSTCFYGCVELSTIPANLLRYHTNNDYSNMFNGCIKLKLHSTIFCSSGEELTRFLNKSPNFNDCFARKTFTGAQGIAPDLWAYDYGIGGIPSNTKCFDGFGNSPTSLSNYADIPTGWK